MIIKSQVTLPLLLPAFIWKFLVWESLGENDIEGVDQDARVVFRQIQREGFAKLVHQGELSWEAKLSDGTQVNLCAFGKISQVCVLDILDHVELSTKCRVYESESALLAMRAGA